MSKRKYLSLENFVMKKIESGTIKMKPRWYFVVGSALLFAGLIISTISSIFAVNLLIFLLRRHYGPMYNYRLNLMLSNFPWWIIPIAILTVGLGMLLLKKYDFSYKKNFPIIFVGYLIIIVASAFFVEYYDINKYWMGNGQMKRLYQKNPENMRQSPMRINKNKGQGNFYLK